MTKPGDEGVLAELGSSTVSYSGEVATESSTETNYSARHEKPDADKSSHSSRIRIGSELVVDGAIFDPLADCLKVIVADAIQKHLEEKLAKHQREQEYFTARLETLVETLSQSMRKLSGVSELKPGREGQASFRLSSSQPKGHPIRRSARSSEDDAAKQRKFASNASDGSAYIAEERQTRFAGANRKNDRAESLKSVGSKSSNGRRLLTVRGVTSSLASLGDVVRATSSDRSTMSKMGTAARRHRKSVFDAVDIYTLHEFANATEKALPSAPASSRSSTEISIIPSPSKEFECSPNATRVSNRSSVPSNSASALPGARSFTSHNDLMPPGSHDYMGSFASVIVADQHRDEPRRSTTSDDDILGSDDDDNDSDDTYIQIGRMKSAAKSKRLTGFNMEALRAKTEMQILSRDSHVAATSDVISESMRLGIVHSSEEDSLMIMRNIPKYVLRVCGVLSFENSFISKLYAAMVLAIILAIISSSVAFAVSDANSQGHMHLVTTCLAVGGLYGFISVRGRGINDLIGNNKVLEKYSFIYGFLYEWHNRSTWHALALCVMFVLAVVFRILATMLTGSTDDMDYFLQNASLAMYVFVSAVSAALAYCQIHVCSGLEIMVESWTSRFFEKEEILPGIIEWNTVQAFLRRTAYVIEPCILSVQTSLLAACVLTGAEVLDRHGIFASADAAALLWGLSVLLQVAMAYYALFQCCAVTEKCLRVPPLLNSISASEDSLRSEYLELVQYIGNSAAGFYVKGVRITTFMMMKGAYILGAVVFALVLQARSQMS